MTELQLGHNIEEAQGHVTVRSGLRSRNEEREERQKDLEKKERPLLSFARCGPAHPRGGGCRAQGSARWRGDANLAHRRPGPGTRLLVLLVL